MHPASSVSGFYFGHPEAKYFGVGMIDRDQVADYSARKAMDIPTLEKWLAPSLSYDPDKITLPPTGNCGCGTAHA
jgi:5-methyltetrahydrofolate--homocysteine methyltransferase